MRTVGLCLLLAIPARLCAQSSYLSYSSYLGGDGEDIVHAASTDFAGNVYLAGETTSSNFPVTAGAFQTKRGNSPGTIFGFEGQFLPNAFVAKLSPAGQILWATYLGGSGPDAALAIAVDAQGSPYVLGYSLSPDFPTTPGAYRTTAPLSNRAFVAKFTPDGSSLVYSTFLSGSMLQVGYVPGGIIEMAVSPSAIAVDAVGNAFLGGCSNSSALPATPGAYSNSGSAFVAKLDASGSKLAFVTYLGGSGNSDIVHGIALDSTGNIYAAGTTGAADFPVTAPFAHNGVGAGGTGAFLVKLDSAGAHAAYSAVFGGTTPTRSAETGATAATAVAVDSNGSAYIAGVTNAANFPTASAAQLQLAGDTDGFLAKVDPTGSQLVYSTYLGGSGAEQVYGLAVDSALRAYVVGETVSVDFPRTASALPLRFAGAPCLISSASPFGNPMFPVDCGDGFVTQFDREGNLSYSTYISGSNTDSVHAIATSGTNVWLAGATRSSDFPVAGPAASDNLAPAVCVNAASPSSSQSYPCGDGFVANLSFGAPSSTPPLRVVNFGSLIDQPVAPADVVTIFGSSIAPGTVSTAQLGPDGKLTTLLGGYQVFFDSVAAPLILVAPGHIAAIVPNEVAGKAHTVIAVKLFADLIPGPTVTVPVNPTAPAIITQDSSGIGQAAAVNPDGTVNSITNPAQAGSIVSLFVIGTGATADGDGAVATSAKPGTAVQVVTGNPYQAAAVLYAGPSPGTISAVTQIDVQLPVGVTGDHVPIYFLAGALSSQSGVTIAVK
ncbi:MAG TPA: SBBP repeat-containing protein [Bryobacteraceae bacterium]|nr:SBBP repeat-containing protein [Bryobacteraceae bacterium]